MKSTKNPIRYKHRRASGTFAPKRDRRFRKTAIATSGNCAWPRCNRRVRPGRRFCLEHIVAVASAELVVPVQNPTDGGTAAIIVQRIPCVFGPLAGSTVRVEVPYRSRTWAWQEDSGVPGYGMLLRRVSARSGGGYNVERRMYRRDKGVR